MQKYLRRLLHEDPHLGNEKQNCGERYCYLDIMNADTYATLLIGDA